MKIAFFLSSQNIVPPLKTGGIEQPTYYLIREMVKLGHEITLYAAAGSKIQGVKVKALSPFPTSVKMPYANLQERIASYYDTIALGSFFNSGEWKDYDLVQFNNYLFYEILPYAAFTKIPIIIQINYPHDLIYRYIKKDLVKHRNVYYLPMSNYIKKLMPGLPYLDRLIPAIDFNDFPFSEKCGDYLLVIGRICPEKGTHLAVEVARMANKKLVIAGGVNQSNHGYFQKFIKPFIDNKYITYIGEIDFKTKIKVYGNALATLFPIQWDEPFGLVMVESMACGTPVVAFDRAAVREIVKDGISGLITKDADVMDMTKAVKRISKLNRKKVRLWAENNFSIVSIADMYENICHKILIN